MDSTDKNIITGLLDLITKEADAAFIADVLDDVYYILAQSLATDCNVMGGKMEIDKSMYYLHMLRDIFANKHVVV